MRDDAIIATGRTDYPNQVNNVLCFPYIFRGALDSRRDDDHASRWRSPRCTRSPSWRRPSRARSWPRPTPARRCSFGPDYLIPKPFDPRLMMQIAPAVAQAAADSGVALRPIADMDAYRDKLQTFVYASGTTMKPIFSAGQARARKKRVAYRRGRGGARAARGAGGGRRRPGAADADRPARRSSRSASRSSACACRPGATTTSSTPSTTTATATTGRPTTAMTERKGVTAQLAKIEMRRRLTLIGAMLLHKGEVDGMLCGTWGTTADAPAVHRPGDRPARRRQDLRLHERADPARPAGVPGRHPRQLRPDAPSSWPRSRCMAAEEMLRFGVQAEGRAAVALATSARSNQPSAREDARRAGAAAARRRPGSRWTARCTATPRSTPPTATS